MMISLRISAMAMALVVMSGCTFVQTNPKAKAVRDATAEEVVNCQRLGQTTVSTLAKVAGLPRYESSMRDELNTLARNSAADMRRYGGARDTDQGWQAGQPRHVARGPGQRGWWRPRASSRAAPE